MLLLQGAEISSGGLDDNSLKDPDPLVDLVDLTIKACDLSLYGVDLCLVVVDDRGSQAALSLCDLPLEL